MVQNKRSQINNYRKPEFPDSLYIIILLALGLLVSLSRYRAGIDFADEGFLAYGAVRVMQGQIPHLDFVSLQPPLAFYTTAAMFKLCGISLVTLRYLGIGIYLGIPLTIFAIARHLCGRCLSFSAAVPSLMLGITYFNFVPFSVWQGITASLLSVLCFLYASSNNQGKSPRYYALIAGMLSGASMLFRHDQGLYTVISIFVYILTLRYTDHSHSVALKPDLKRLAFFWISGMALVFLTSGIYCLIVGAIPEMFKQLILFPITTYAHTSSLPFPRFESDRVLSYNAMVFLYYLPPLIDALAIIWIFAQKMKGRFSLNETKLLFITTWSGLFYCQVLTRSDNHHLLITLAPFFILCAWFWHIIGENMKHVISIKYKSSDFSVHIPLLASSIAALIIGCYLIVLKPVFLSPLFEPREPILLERAGVQIQSQDARALKKIIEGVQNIVRPDESILCLPYQPMLYFLCERRNPTRWNYIWPGDQTSDDHQRLIRQAESDPPAAIIITDEGAMSQYAPIIINYVHRQYKRRFDIGLSYLYLP